MPYNSQYWGAQAPNYHYAGTTYGSASHQQAPQTRPRASSYLWDKYPPSASNLNHPAQSYTNHFGRQTPNHHQNIHHSHVRNYNQPGAPRRTSMPSSEDRKHTPSLHPLERHFCDEFGRTVIETITPIFHNGEWMETIRRQTLSNQYTRRGTAFDNKYGHMAHSSRDYAYDTSHGNTRGHATSHHRDDSDSRRFQYKTFMYPPGSNDPSQPQEVPSKRCPNHTYQDFQQPGSHRRNGSTSMPPFSSQAHQYQYQKRHPGTGKASTWSHDYTPPPTVKSDNTYSFHHRKQKAGTWPHGKNHQSHWDSRYPSPLHPQGYGASNQFEGVHAMQTSVEGHNYIYQEPQPMNSTGLHGSGSRSSTRRSHDFQHREDYPQQPPTWNYQSQYYTHPTNTARNRTHSATSAPPSHKRSHNHDFRHHTTRFDTHMPQVSEQDPGYEDKPSHRMHNPSRFSHEVPMNIHYKYRQPMYTHHAHYRQSQSRSGSQSNRSRSHDHQKSDSWKARPGSRGPGGCHSSFDPEDSDRDDKAIPDYDGPPPPPLQTQRSTTSRKKPKNIFKDIPDLPDHEIVDDYHAQRKAKHQQYPYAHKREQSHPYAEKTAEFPVPPHCRNSNILNDDNY